MLQKKISGRKTEEGNFSHISVLRDTETTVTTAPSTSKRSIIFNKTFKTLSLNLNFHIKTLLSCLTSYKIEFKLNKSISRKFIVGGEDTELSFQGHLFYGHFSHFKAF